MIFIYVKSQMLFIILFVSLCVKKFLESVKYKQTSQESHILLFEIKIALKPSLEFFALAFWAFIVQVCIITVLKYVGK